MRIVISEKTGNINEQILIENIGLVVFSLTSGLHTPSVFLFYSTTFGAGSFLDGSHFVMAEINTGFFVQQRENNS